MSRPLGKSRSVLGITVSELRKRKSGLRSHSKRCAASRCLAIEPLEERALLTGTLYINGTSAKSDNIIMLGDNTPMPAVLTNTDTTHPTCTFRIKSYSSNVSLGSIPSSITLAKSQQFTFYITPRGLSSRPNDIVIEATDQYGCKAVDTMTVVDVRIQQTIFNADSPEDMRTAGHYRIPPVRSTPVTVTVTPSLRGDTTGQSVTLAVTGQSDETGTVRINGQGENAPIRIDGSTPLPLQLAGVKQTSPGHAAQLRLELTGVGNRPAPRPVKSEGFSVAAIPVAVRQVSVRDSTVDHGLAWRDFTSSTRLCPTAAG